MMIKFALPLLSAALLAFAVVQVSQTAESLPLEDPPRQPPRASRERIIAATGIVQPPGGCVEVGAPVHGLVARVLVEAGDRVSQGDPLFQLDDRHLRAEVQAQEAAVSVAKAELARVESPPRDEETAAADAQIAEAEARLAGRRDHLSRVEKIHQQQASTAGEVNRSRSDVKEAEAQVARLKSAKSLLLQGATQQERQAARAAVELAIARRRQVAAEIERLTVRAPFDARILRVDVRPTQAVGPGGSQPLLVLARDGGYEMRVDIHEDELACFDLQAPAQAVTCGGSEPIPLKPVRVEPYVLPQSPNRGPFDQVDARVLQAIYAIPRSAAQRLFPGQQLDVFISVGVESDATAD
jgi:HlyD family secretion protein